MTSTRFVAAESSDPKQRVGIASPHLEEKILQVFFALPVSGALGPGLGGREARRKAGCHAPGCPDEPRAVQMNPCPPHVLPPQLRRAAEDHPLPLSCGPAPSRLKWRRPPCPSTAAASAWPYPAAQGLRGERAPGHGRCRRSPAGGRLGALPGLLWPPARHCGVAGVLSPRSPSLPGAFHLSAARTDGRRVGDPRSSLSFREARRHPAWRRGRPELPPGCPGGGLPAARSEQRRAPSRLLSRGISAHQRVYN